jgi:hypothetical protein
MFIIRKTDSNGTITMQGQLFLAHPTMIRLESLLTLVLLL